MSVACMRVQDEPGREVARSLSAIKLVQSNAGLVLLSTSINVSFPSATTAGNLLIAVASSPSANTSYNTPAGWTVADDEFNNGLGQIVFYKYASGSETSLTVNGFGTLVHTLQLFEFLGIDPTVAPTIATRTGQTQGTYAFPSVTTSANGSLVLVAGVSSGSMLLVPNFDSWSNGFTEANDFTIVLLNSVVSAYGFVGAAGSWNASANSSALGTMLSHAITFQRRPGIVTDLAVSASANKNIVMFTPPSAPLSHIVMLARTGDCSFTAVNPTGAEAIGASVGGGTVIFNNSPTANLSSTSVTVGTSTLVSYNAATSALTHSSLVAGTLYCYKAYARNSTSLDDGDPARPTRSGRPTAGGASNPLFVFNSGSTSLSAPSVLPGVGVFYADNNGKLTSVDKTGLRRFRPYTLPNAVQNRSPTGTLSADADATVYSTSLSGDAYAVWASGALRGTLRWSSESIDGDSFTASVDEPLGASLYASPLVSNTLGRVFVPTRNAVLAQNRVYALHAATGACVWVFNGTCAGASTGLNVGQVSASGVLDPINSRLLFTSTSLWFGATLWAVDARDGIAGDRRLWSRNIGDSDSSITFSSAARSSILVGTNAGSVYHLDPANGATCWASTSDGCPGTAVGTEQFFCADASGARATSCNSGSPIQKGIAMLNGAYSNSVLFRTADGNVWRVSTAGVRLWKTLLSGASTPTPASELNSGVAYVGGSDGVIREISLATGSVNNTRSVGGGAIVAGDATYDSADGVLYVNTSQGNLYAFSVPF